jgi:hypothetical protein
MSKRKQQSPKKLRLGKASVRRLAEEQLAQVDGGGESKKDCYFSYGCPIKTNR